MKSSFFWLSVHQSRYHRKRNRKAPELDDVVKMQTQIELAFLVKIETEEGAQPLSHSA